MPAHRTLSRTQSATLPLVLLVVMLCALWIAGGASRPEVAGQAIVRLVATVCLVALALFGTRHTERRGRPVAILLGAAITVAVVQLVPLPPGAWSLLPGRTPFVAAGQVTGDPQPWRPLAIVPGAAMNALFSLLVPAAMLAIMMALRRRDNARMLGLLLGFIGAATLVGLLQFSGIDLRTPFLNRSSEVSGNLANHNHFALVVAFGCLIAPVWALQDDARTGWRGPVALGLVLLFALTILASGSRAGTIVGAIALMLGGVLSWPRLRVRFRRYPRWALPAVIGGAVVAIVAVVLVSISADRAMSINRAVSVDVQSDMRSRGLPVVLSMVREYMPFGSGLGGFDPLFRLHEPFGLLKPTYYNHAHNDFLEIALDTGVAGIVLMTGALLWFVIASLRAWRRGTWPDDVFARLGSAMLLLILIASVVDYPARTPIVMALAVIAAAWLGDRPDRGSPSALPPTPHSI